MFYVIEAVRWGANGNISHVRWHGVDMTGDTLVKTDSSVVPVLDAAAQCKEHEVRVYIEGDAGRFFRMRACPQGLDAEPDGTQGSLRERLAHLPSF